MPLTYLESALINIFLCHNEPYVATMVVYNCYTNYLVRLFMKLQRLLAILSLLCERDNICGIYLRDNTLIGISQGGTS